MQILIAQETLSSLLSKAQSVLERKSTRPILESILLVADGDKLQVSVTDLRVSLSQEAPCAVERPGSIAVPGRKMHEIVREMPKGEISLHVKENQWVTVSMGKSVFHLPGSPADEYPALPTPPSSFLSLEAASFRQMLEKTLFAASSDESRIYLCGVYVKAIERDGESYLRMVATDGHRLSLVDRPLRQELGAFERGVIIPKKGLSELRGLLEAAAETFDIAASDGRVFARVGTTALAVTLIDASYPNYEQVIPADQPARARMNRLRLMDALRRVSLLSDQETHSVVLETVGTTAVLNTTNPQFGDAREELEATHVDQGMKVAFNAVYFLDALRVIDGDEVELAMSDSLAPCVVRGPQDAGYLCVIMPMRID